MKKHTLKKSVSLVLANILFLLIAFVPAKAAVQNEALFQILL